MTAYRRPRRSALFKRFKHWFGSRVLPADNVRAAPSRMLTAEERRAFRRFERHCMIAVAVILVSALLCAGIFIIHEVMSDFEARAFAARDVTHIPPR